MKKICQYFFVNFYFEHELTQIQKSIDFITVM